MSITICCSIYSKSWRFYCWWGLWGRNVQLQLVPMLCLIARQKPNSCSYHCAQEWVSMTFTVGKYTIFNAFAIACIYMYVHTYIHAYRHTLFDIMAYGPFIIDGTLGSFVGCCNSQSAPIATDCIQQTLPKVHYYCESGYWCACKPG